MDSLAPALTLTLTQNFSLNHLANKQLQSSHSLYSLINSSGTSSLLIPKLWRNLLRHVTSVLRLVWTNSLPFANSPFAYTSGGPTILASAGPEWAVLVSQARPTLRKWVWLARLGRCIVYVDFWISPMWMLLWELESPSMEELVQQFGRAGRDGRAAKGMNITTLCL